MPSFVNRLQVATFRHFSQQTWQFHPKVNVILGANGSGKTSILEALYFLGVGRSFRSNVLQNLIQQGESEFTLFTEVTRDTGDLVQLSLRRAKRLPPIQKLDGQVVKSTAELARWLPLLHLCPDSFQLLTAGGKQRRRLLDWGVFYQNTRFISIWRDFNRVLLQRNAALKQKQPYRLLALWDQRFSELAIEIDKVRETYFADYMPVLKAQDPDFWQGLDVEVTYVRGWSAGKPLLKVLEDNYTQDLRYGSTQYGPHRADVKFKIGQLPARDILSRGQQKRLVVLLKLAQGACFQHHTQSRCVYLLDDIYSELDVYRANEMTQMVQQQAAQLFLTAIDEHRVPEVLLSAKESTQIQLL